MPRILILTTEPLPLPGLPTTGAGLRAWGLAMGLRAAGLDVRLLMPIESIATWSGSAGALTSDWPAWVGSFRRAKLRAAVRAEAPDAVVLQHWGLAAELGEPEWPLAIDLAGPHLIERRLWGSPDPEADLIEKLDALRRADFLTCSGERQRLYFLPYLAMAGWPLETADLLPVIPFAMAPAPEPPPPRPDRFIYGGFLLPWQDPTGAIETTLEALDGAGRGELLFIGGAHPSVDVSRGRFEPLLARLRDHPRVRLIPSMAWDDYWSLLREGGVALDLMARNPERELAFTTRTVVYLAAGLPVIHDDYSELADLITRGGGGWAIAPGDRMALRRRVESILSGEVNLVARSHAALELVRDRLHWDYAARPLAEWCRDPRPRIGKLGVRLAFEERDRRLASAEAELQNARRDLATLRGKRWIRWGLGLTTARAWLRAPLALLAALAGLAVFFAILAGDLASRLLPPSRAPSGSSDPERQVLPNK